jgi:hypothetical protein
MPSHDAPLLLTESDRIGRVRDVFDDGLGMKSLLDLCVSSVFLPLPLP